MRVQRLILIAVLGAAGWLSATGAHGDMDYHQLILTLPAPDADTMAAQSAALLKLGAGAIVVMCADLKAPGGADDTIVRFMLSGLAKHVTRVGAPEPERALYAGAVLEGLANAQDKEIKAFLIGLLQMAGRDECVPALAALLNDERLCEPAAQALLAIHTAGVPDVFLNALPGVDAKLRITLVKALGELRCAKAVNALLPDAASADPVVRQVAWQALANIGDPAAQGVFQKAMQSDSSYERAKATASYLLFARRRFEAGDKGAAEAVCREIYAARADTREVQAACAALALLADVRGDGILDDLLAVMDRPDASLRGAALHLADRAPGDAATKAWVKKMAGVQPGVRAEIARMLGLRGDKAAVPALVDAARSEDKALRLTAYDALTHFQSPDVQTTLMTALLGARDDDEIAAAKAALLRVPGTGVTDAVAGEVAKAAPATRKALIEILAARDDSAHAALVFERTKDDDAAVRMAALRGLGGVAEEKDLPAVVALLLAAATDEERDAVRGSLIAAAKRIEDPAKRADAVLAVWPQTSDEQKPLLLKTLPDLAGPGALDAVTAAIKAENASVRDAALHALAVWPERTAIPALLEIVKTAPDAAVSAVAAEGYLRLAAGAPEKLDLYQQALQNAAHPEDKKTVLKAVGEVRAIEAARLAAGCLGDEALKGDAAAAVAHSVCPPKEGEPGLQGDEAAALLKQALDALQDEGLRKKAETWLSTTATPKTP